MLKSIKIAPFLMILIFGQAAADEAVEYCNTVGELAKIVMANRQSGISFEETSQMITANLARNQTALKVGMTIVFEAYKDIYPAYNDDGRRTLMIDFFGNLMRELCQKK